MLNRHLNENRKDIKMDELIEYVICERLKLNYNDYGFLYHKKGECWHNGGKVWNGSIWPYFLTWWGDKQIFFVAMDDVFEQDFDSNWPI